MTGSLCNASLCALRGFPRAIGGDQPANALMRSAPPCLVVLGSETNNRARTVAAARDQLNARGAALGARARPWAACRITLRRRRFRLWSEWSAQCLGSLLSATVPTIHPHLEDAVKSLPTNFTARE